MVSIVQPYLDLILRERSWSWAIVCLLYVLAGLFVRGWFTGPLSNQMKGLDKKFSHKLRKIYLKNSMLGWLFFFLPNALIVICWRKAVLPFPVDERLLISLSIFSFILSVLLHLQAFGSASLSAFSSVHGEKSLTDH